MPSEKELKTLVANAEQTLIFAYQKKGGFKIDESRDILRDSRLTLLTYQVTKLQKQVAELQKKLEEKK